MNTFTVGNIKIDLSETPTEDEDEDDTTNSYWMLEAKQELAKDPVVTVSADSVESWLFVCLEESENFADYLTYDVADGWNELVNYSGVYFRQVGVSGEDQEFSVLKEDKVTVKDLTEEELSLVTKDNAPTLSITAYAVQKDSVANAQQAWTEILAQTAEG